MNAYRVALILCRAVSVALWWMAGIRVVAVAIMFIAAQFNISGMKSVPVTQLSFSSSLVVVPLVIGAVFLQLFAASLATSMTGKSSFEGDAIASRRALDASEKALGNAGAGLFLLFFGAASAVIPLFLGGYTLLFGGFGVGIGSSVAIYSALNNLVPAILHCFVGFLLAFQRGLQRIAKVR